MSRRTVMDTESEVISDTESDTDTDVISDTESDYDDENHSIIRAKWQMDGSNTLDECVEKLQYFIEHIKYLKTQGWELQKPVDDDYGFIRKS
jgi:hypothetical protein